VATGGGFTLVATNPLGVYDGVRVVSATVSRQDRGVKLFVGSATAAVAQLGAFGGNNTAVPWEATGMASSNWSTLWFTPTNAFDYTGSACVQFGTIGSPAQSFTPAPQPEPAGYLSPLRDVDPTLDGIAAEVRLLEFKLDTLLTILQAVAGATLDLGGDASDPTDVAPNTDIQLKDAAGVVLEASGIPASRSLDFGTPQHIVKLARLNVGNVDGWYPSVWVTHTPFVLRPLPQGVTKMTVTDITPGVTMTSRLLAKTK
jgi:hypothetical protein